MKYEVATAEAPRTARRRAGFADAAERDEVCIERRKDALAIVLSMVVGEDNEGAKDEVGL